MTAKAGHRRRVAAHLFRRFHARVPTQPPARGLRHEPISETARTPLALSLVRRADAAAAGRQHHQPIIRRHFLEALAAQLLAGPEPDVTGRAVASAVTPA